jgi:hypothetical protein
MRKYGNYKKLADTVPMRVQRLTQKVWKYAKLAPKQVTGGPGAKIIAPGEVAPKF